MRNEMSHNCKNNRDNIFLNHLWKAEATNELGSKGRPLDLVVSLNVLDKQKHNLLFKKNYKKD